MVSSGSWFLVKNVPFPSDILVRIKIFTEWVFIQQFTGPSGSPQNILYIPSALGMPCAAMWRTSPSSILFHSSPAFCHVIFTHCWLILVKKKKKIKKIHTMHLRDCLNLYPECAFKAKLSKQFGALVCSVKQTKVWECWKQHWKMAEQIHASDNLVANGHSPVGHKQSYPK